MDEALKISVVTPSFNEEKAVAQLIEAIRKNTAAGATEIVVVDSSADRTAEIARGLGARVIHQDPQGHGVALRTAMSAAQNDIIITTDCDNTYPMEYISKVAAMVAGGDYDVVSCNRLTKMLSGQMPFSNKLANMGFAFLVRALYGINVHDVTTGMFCIRKGALAKMSLKNNYSLPCEIIIRSKLAGLKHAEIDIPYRIRIGEVKLKKWRSGLAYLRCIFNYKLGLNIDPESM